MTHSTCRLVLAACGLALTLAGCGGSPAAPAVIPDPDQASITITITAAGVSPAQLSVPAGTRVLFINNDSRQHEMTSDPHPEHTDCIEINQVGFISPGRTRETGNLNTVRTCGFHDHGDPTNTRLQGRIVIR